MTFAHVTQRKSTSKEVYSQYLTKAAVADLVALGRNRLILKTDPEPAMVALQECVKAASNSEIILRNSPVGESQSNGVVDKAVRDIGDHVRTLKDAAEDRLNITIGVKSPLLTWLVEHAAWLYNNCHEGKDKKTALERLQGGRSVKPLAEVGESILYKPLSTKGDSVDKLEARFEEGIWLGVESRTGEIRVGTPSGVVKSRTIRRRIEAERWNAAAAQEITGTPWNPSPRVQARTGSAVIDVPGQAHGDPDAVHAEPGFQARRMMLSK